MRTRQSAVHSHFLLGMFLVLAFGLGASASWAQIVKGAIEGTIEDSTGAAVPGAQIDVLDPATSSSGHATSDITGTFRIPLLAVGTYNLTVNKEGFHKLSLTVVQVNSAVTTKVGTLRLEIGQITTTVEVTGHPTLVEATQAQITNTMPNSMLTLLHGWPE